MKDKLILAGITASAFLAVYPVAFLLTGSLMNPSELQENLAPVVSGADETYASWSLLPFAPTLQSYVKVLLEQPEFFVVFWNSVKVTLGVLAGQMLFGVPAAWAFAQYEFKGKKVLFTMYIIFMMLPFQVLMLSEYLVLHNLLLIDSLWALIIPGVFSTFSVFVIYNFFRGIPRNILEAARLDGAGEFRLFIQIGLPLGKTGIIAAMTLQFLEYWNIIEQPMVFLEQKSLWPLSLYLPSITLENAGQSFVASVITLIPALFVFFYGKDHLEKGIIASAVKE
ncbi:MAG: carbohydrate ABC transporter permease [Bacillota bacterium]|nr:carbohydrate ABC transporter permease [Bacillota bacterium]